MGTKDIKASIIAEIQTIRLDNLGSAKNIPRFIIESNHKGQKIVAKAEKGYL